MNELQIFNNPEFGDIRTVTIDNEPWFVGKDVAIALGYSNPRKALGDHVDEEDRCDGVTIRDSIGRAQNPTLINESGLYSLIFSSKLESARAFKRWVTSEVLPTLRKTGRYEIKSEKQHLSTRPLTTDDYVDAAKTIVKCHNSRLQIVLDLYQKAGLDISKLTSVRGVVESDADENVDLVELLNQYNVNDLVKMLGFCKTSIYYYRTGRYKPREARRKLIIGLLTEKG